jgi:hypothetical protein
MRLSDACEVIHVFNNDAIVELNATFDKNIACDKKIYGCEILHHMCRNCDVFAF